MPIHLRNNQSRHREPQAVDWGSIVPDVPMLNVATVPWPQHKAYGPDHHQKAHRQEKIHALR